MLFIVITKEEKKMMKTIRVLEVPLLLLLAAIHTTPGWCLAFTVLSVIRLWINVISDKAVYKDTK